MFSEEQKGKARTNILIQKWWGGGQGKGSTAQGEEIKLRKITTVRNRRKKKTSHPRILGARRSKLKVTQLRVREDRPIIASVS